MPRLDGTGPMGKGPMTGRGLGNCMISVDKSDFIKAIDDNKISAGSNILDAFIQDIGIGFRRRHGFRCRKFFR